MLKCPRKFQLSQLSPSNKPPSMHCTLDTHSIYKIDLHFRIYYKWRTQSQGWIILCPDSFSQKYSVFFIDILVWWRIFLIRMGALMAIEFLPDQNRSIYKEGQRKCVSVAAQRNIDRSETSPWCINKGLICILFILLFFLELCKSFGSLDPVLLPYLGHYILILFFFFFLWNWCEKEIHQKGASSKSLDWSLHREKKKKRWILWAG